MTCSTPTSRGESKSRIDRIFYWTNFHAVATKTHVQRIPHLSNHKAVFTTITTSSIPESTSPQAKIPQLNTRNASTETKEKIAKAIHDLFSRKNKHLIPQIKNWDKDLHASNEGIKQASIHIKEIAHKFFFTPPRERSEESKTKLRIKNLNKILRRLETLQLLKIDRFPKRKTQNLHRINREIKIVLRDSTMRS